MGFFESDYKLKQLEKKVRDLCGNFCCKVLNCLGISITEGQEDLVLNQKGEWIVNGSGGFSCSSLNSCSTTNLPEGTNLYFTCQKVEDCLGIEAMGDPALFLNQQGDFVSAGSGGTPALNQYQIAFGDASNLMTSSSTLAFDGLTLFTNTAGSASGWGQKQLLIQSASSEAGIVLENTGTGGRSYAIISTSDASGAGGGNLSIGDATAGINRFMIDSTGAVSIFDLAGNGSGFVAVDNTGLLSFSSNTVTLTDTQVAFGDSSNNVTSSTDFTWDDPNKNLSVGDKGNIGNNIVLSIYNDDTPSSAESSLEEVGIGGFYLYPSTASAFTPVIKKGVHLNLQVDQYRFGTNACNLQIDNGGGNSSLSIGDTQNTLNNTVFSINDVAQTYTLNKLGGSGIKFVTVDNSGLLGINDALGLVIDTYTNINALISTNSINVGWKYLISDRADLGILLDGTSTNSLSLQGSGGFLNPDFQDIGDYSGVSAVTGIAKGTNQKVWFDGNEVTYANGDIVFWNGLHYQVTNDATFDGNDPETNNSAYTTLAKTDANVGYISSWDFVEFSFEVSNPIAAIIVREDNLRNRVVTSWFNFQWGNELVRENVFETGIVGAVTIINQRGTVQWNTINNSSSLTLTNDFEATFLGNTLTERVDITLGNSSGNNITNCTFGGAQNIFLPDEEANKKTSVTGFSNFECTVDVTGLTTLDITAANNYCGIINLTGGATEGINEITNFPTQFPFTLNFPTITAFTITGASTAIITDDQIALPTATFIGNGTNGDFITLQSGTINSAVVTKQINSQIYI